MCIRDRLRDDEKSLREKLHETKENWSKDNVNSDSEVTENEIAEIISLWTGIPVKHLRKAKARDFSGWRKYCTAELSVRTRRLKLWQKL